MIDLHAVAVVLSTYLVGVVSPGPNFVAVAHKGASATLREALALVAGIVVVNLFWASCAILGIGVVFAVFPWLALVVKVGGALYLVWFGLRLVARAAPAADATAARESGSLAGAFRTGFATNIANPKSIAFYAAVIAAAAPRHVSTPTFLAMVATIGVVSSCWYSLVAGVFARPAVAARYRRGQAWADRACGAVIVALGVRQLVR